MMLTTTKTKLYDLCKTFHPDMPKMKDTQFTKLDRKPTWWLTFRTSDYTYHEMSLSAAAGRPYLSDKWRDESDESQWECHTLKIPQLRELGMIQE